MFTVDVKQQNNNNWSFGITWLILGQFKNRVPLKPVLGSVVSVAPVHYCTYTVPIKRVLYFRFFNVLLSFKDPHSELCMYTYNALSDDLQITKTVTSLTFFGESVEIVSAL